MVLFCFNLNVTICGDVRRKCGIDVNILFCNNVVI